MESTVEIRLLDFCARLEGPAPILEEIAAIYPATPSWAHSASDEVAADFLVETDAPQPTSYRIVCDGNAVWWGSSRNEVVAAAEWAVNTAAVAAMASSYLLFHSGVVAYGTCGVLLPGASGTGKSTLVAALASAGLCCLGDEVAALEPHTGRLLPFGNAPAVKRGGLRLLRSLCPEMPRMASLRRIDGVSVWYLRASEPTWPHEPVPVRYVIFPARTFDHSATLTPLSRPDGLARLLAQAINTQAHGAAGMATLVATLRDAECYDLGVGDLEETVDLVMGLVAPSGGAQVGKTPENGWVTTCPA